MSGVDSLNVLHDRGGRLDTDFTTTQEKEESLQQHTTGRGDGPDTMRDNNPCRIHAGQGHSNISFMDCKSMELMILQILT